MSGPVSTIVATDGDEAEPAGLRERKKARTRATIREEALRLVRTHGYHDTTVEKIAAAAEISPATFFRYFPTKEDLILQDDIDLVALEAFEAQPPELGPVAAYRAAVAGTLGAMSTEDVRRFTETAQLKLSIPEVRARAVDELARTIDSLAESIARRAAAAGPGAVPSGPSADDTAVRSTAGAIVGVLIASTLPLHDSIRSADAGDAAADLRSLGERIDAGLRYLEDGLPRRSDLTGPGDA